jgi:hypothetical protein
MATIKEEALTPVQLLKTFIEERSHEINALIPKPIPVEQRKQLLAYRGVFLKI